MRVSLGTMQVFRIFMTTSANYVVFVILSSTRTMQTSTAVQSDHSGYFIGHNGTMTNWFAERTVANSLGYLSSLLKPEMRILDS